MEVYMFIFSNKNPKLSKCFSDHREDVVNCYGKFEEFFKVLFSENPDQAVLDSIKIKVDNCENAADGELRHVVDLLSDSFLPTTRTHMITLVQSTDDVANLCQEIVRHVMLEKIQFPAAIREDLLEIIAITKVQLSILYKAVDLLINDFKTLNDDRKVLDDVRAEESKVDNIQAALHQRIFALDISLAEKVYYRDMMEHICDLSDMIEDISDKIQIMLVEREA
jgi:predicted phosphate transport protein (TIGR00153 family)